MQGVLHDKYYTIGSLERYLVQIRSQARSSGIKLPEVHGVGKSLDPNILPEKQVKQPLVSKVKVPEPSQTKPRLGQGRAGLRCKKPQINQPTAQLVKQPLKMPEDSDVQNTMTKAPNFATPVQSKGDSSAKVIDRKIMQDTSKEITFYPDPVYRPPPKPVKMPIPKIPRSRSDTDPELNIYFEDNSPYLEGVISELYQRLDKSYFQEP